MLFTHILSSYRNTSLGDIVFIGDDNPQILSLYCWFIMMVMLGKPVAGSFKLRSGN